MFDGSNITFNQLALNYKFDKDGLPLQIGEISLEYYSLPIKTKFVFFNKILNNEYDFDVLGNPSFDNIYEQLIFQPNPDYNHINSQYFLSDTALLAKFQESFRKQFLESSVFNNQYRYLDSNMDSLPISINLIHDDFFIDKYGKFNKIESNLKIYQSIFYQQDTTISIFPILDLANSKIYTKIDDPYINQWALNLVCFSYRQDQTAISSIANKNVNPKKMISDFEKKRILYNDFLNSTLLQNKNTIPQLLKVNSAIDSSSNYNVFTHIINRDFGSFECKENLISEIIQQGYRAKRKKISKTRILILNTELLD